MRCEPCDVGTIRRIYVDPPCFFVSVATQVGGIVEGGASRVELADEDIVVVGAVGLDSDSPAGISGTGEADSEGASSAIDGNQSAVIAPRSSQVSRVDESSAHMEGLTLIVEAKAKSHRPIR